MLFQKFFARKTLGLKQQWMFNANSALLNGAVLDDINNDGKKELVFATKQGSVFAIDETSRIIWVYNIAEKHSDIENMFIDIETTNTISGMPLIADINNDGKKEIVFGSESGNVFALNSSGRLIWKYTAKGAVRGGIYATDMDNDKQIELVFGANDKGLYVLNSKGKLVLKYNAKSEIESLPYVFRKRIIFGCNDGSVNAIDFRGKLLWTFKAEGKVMAQAVESNFGKETILLLGSFDGKLYAVDENGRLKWDFKTEGAIFSKAVVWDVNMDGKNEIIFTSCDNNVYVLTEEGIRIWSYETDFWITSSPIICDFDHDSKPEIIIGSYDSNIYILEGEGDYIMDYVPGVNTIVSQPGYYDLLTNQPGKYVGKKSWQFQTQGPIVGIVYNADNNAIFTCTDEGIIERVCLEKK